MPDTPKPFYLVNNGTELTAYRLSDDTPWFIIESRRCAGHNAEQKTAAFREAVKLVQTAFGPLADYRELRAPTLPGMQP